MTVTGEENGKRAAGAGGHQLEPSRKGRSAWAPVASTRARLLPLWRQARELFAGSPTLRRLLLDAGLITGGGLMFAALIVIIRNDGGLGYDTPAYWLAARHAAEGAPLYTTDRYTTLGLYTYPPVFAQLFVPAGLLPKLLVSWLWRISSVLCLRYIVGSWKATVVSFAFIPLLTELSTNNVTMQLAAALVFAMRDRRGAYLVPWAAALKFGPVLIVPYLWLRRPDTRRPLLLGTLVFLAACAASFALAPLSWRDYVDMLRFQNVADLSGTQVMHLIPSGGGIDFVARFGLAAVVALWATHSKRAWLAYAAASITCPVMAISRFAPLVGLWGFRQPPETAEEHVAGEVQGGMVEPLVTPA